MMGISRALSADNVKRYHRQSIMRPSAYYVETELLHGYWLGDLAPVWDVHGKQVTALHFDRAAEGKDLLTGEQHIKVRAVKREEAPVWAIEILASSEGAARKMAARDEVWRKHLSAIVGAAIDPAAATYAGNPFALGFEHGEMDAPARRAPKKDLPKPKWSETQKQLISMHEEAARVYRENLAGPAGQKVREYLAERGFTAEMLEKFGVGWSVSHAQLAQRFAGRYSEELMEASGLFVKRGERLTDFFRSRIMFPIQSTAGETIAFGARRTDDEDHAKYINTRKTSIYDKSATLYNVHRAKESAQAEGQTVPVEGYLDVIAADAAGVHNVVGICGTSLTKQHAKQLRSLGSDVLMNLDGDAAGLKAMARHAPVLINAGLEVSCLSFGGGADPADVCNRPGGQEYYRLRVKHTATPLIQWGFEQAAWAIKEQEPSAYRGVDAAKNMLKMFEGIAPEKRERFARDLSKYLKQPTEKKKDKFLSRRAAWDIVFSPDKSVSLAALTGGDDRLIEAHRRAVQRAMKVVERYVQAKMGNTNPAEHTGKLLAACFDHDSSRAIDRYEAAQLHTHCVMFNMTQVGARFRAMETAWIFEARELAKATYQMSMKGDIRECGYKLKSGKNRAPAIAGFSPEYLASESKRGKRINEQAEALGLVGARSKSLIAQSGREKKHKLTPEQRHAAHRANGEKFGHQADIIVRESIQNQRAIEVSPERRAQIAEKAVTYARRSLGHHSAIFETHQILGKALYRGNGYLGLTDVEEELARQVQAGKYIEVDHGRKNAPGPRYTTPELQHDARFAIEKMREGLGACAPIGEAPKVEGLNAGQQEALEYFCASKDKVFGFRGKAGSGKCLAPGTPVLFYGGTIGPVESVRVGDLLMGPDSKPRKVLSLAHGFDEMFRVIPRKGDPYVVNKPHILSLQMSSVGAQDRGGQIVNISVSDYLRSGKTFRKNAKGWRTGVSFPARPVELSPYFLGLWLGDGSCHTQSICNPEPEIREFLYGYANQFGLHLRVVNQSDTTRCPVLNISLGWRKGVKNKVGDNPVLQGLRNLGVIRNKHVPLAYKANSESVRLELLAGLMDTDGSLATGYYEYSSVSRELANDVAFLARSVGLYVNISAAQKGCQTGAVGTYYRLCISGHIDKIPAKVARKRASPRRQIKDVLRTGIKVEECGVGEYFGFELDGDGLFLLGDFTVTHNTTTLRKMDESARGAGFITRGVGPTGQAQIGLADAGIESETIQAYVMRSKDDRDPQPRWYFVDEASMVDGGDMKEFMARLRPQDRSIIVFDTQHESVGEGRIYKDLQEAGMPVVGLHEIVRQRKNPELLKTVQVISNGDINRGLELLAEQNCITSVSHRGERFAAMAMDYSLDPRGCLILTPDNASRKELSGVIRKCLHMRGQLEKEEWTARILIGKRADSNEEDVKVAGSYDEDDILRYRKGSRNLKIKAGERAKVLEVDEDANTITVKLESSGRQITYNPEDVHGVEVYVADKADFSNGDRIQFTRRDDKLKVVNGQTGTITFLDRAGNCRIELDRGGREVSFNLRQMPYIDHAYVMTSYKAQGATVRRALVHIDTGDTKHQHLLNQTMFYVSATRPEEELRVFTDDHTRLAKVLNRQIQNESALSPKQKLEYHRQVQGMVA